MPLIARLSLNLMVALNVACRGELCGRRHQQHVRARKWFGDGRMRLGYKRARLDHRVRCVEAHGWPAGGR